jgi:hypothetical protein
MANSYLQPSSYGITLGALHYSINALPLQEDETKQIGY